MSEKYFTELYNNYIEVSKKAMYNIGLTNKSDAEELANDVFMKIYSTLDDEIDKPYSLVVKYSKNAARTFIKKNKLHTSKRTEAEEIYTLSTDDGTVSDLQLDPSLFEEVFDYEEELDSKLHIIYAEIRKLPSKQRSVMEMLLVRKLDIDYICNILEINRKAFFKHRLRAIATIKKRLDIETSGPK